MDKSHLEVIYADKDALDTVEMGEDAQEEVL